MKKKFSVLIIIAALLIIIAVAAFFGGRYAIHSFFYPKPRVLPPVVSQTTDELLARLQIVLKKLAPDVAQALQPGLSDAQISSLEAQGGFHLSPDLRTLYRWHNGTGTNQNVEFIRGHRFPSLDYIVKDRLADRAQLKSISTIQGLFYSIFAKHRDPWVSILPDGAGDGYFYDPNRTEREGSFFYSFAETRWFIWFPSFRNFLSGVIEGYEGGLFQHTRDSSKLQAECEKELQIWSRLGTSIELE